MRLKSASNACPMASCRSIPDAPAPMTTGILPPLGLRASNLASIPLTASAASSSRSSPVRSSSPWRKLLEAVLFSLRVPSLNITDAVTLPIGLASYVSSPYELNIRISLCEYDILAMILTALLSRANIRSCSFSRNGTSPDALVLFQDFDSGYSISFPTALPQKSFTFFPPFRLPVPPSAIREAARAASCMSSGTVLSEYAYPVFSPLSTRIPTPKSEWSPPEVTCPSFSSRSP